MFFPDVIFSPPISHYGNFEFPIQIRQHTDADTHATHCTAVGLIVFRHAEIHRYENERERERSWKESFNGIAHSFETF